MEESQLWKTLSNGICWILQAVKITSIDKDKGYKGYNKIAIKIVDKKIDIFENPFY